MTSTPSPAEHLEGVIAELQERWFFARAIDLTANPDAAPMVRDGDVMLTVLTFQAALIAQRESEIERLARENAHLRLIHQKVGCPYGHGNAESGCSLSYPGCACMDDALAMMAWGPEDEDKAAVRLGQRLKSAEARLQQAVEGLEPLRSLYAAATVRFNPATMYGADYDKEQRVRFRAILRALGPLLAAIQGDSQ